MISPKDLDTIRSIARTGGDYGAIKQLLAGTTSKIEEDAVDLGFLRVFILDAADECCRLITGYHDPDRPALFIAHVFRVSRFEEHLAAFNAAFQSATATSSP